MATHGPSIVFITGATAGIGEACAKQFAADGAKLVLTGRRADRLESLAKTLPTKVHTAVMDVRDRSAVERVVSDLPAEFRDVDLLINNAGIAVGIEPADRARIEAWEEMIRTNIDGLLYCTHALLPGMVARGRGHVINMGSVAGTYPYPGGNVYGATKAFVEQLSLNLRADLVSKNIRVTNIEPGMVETEFSEVRFGGDKDKAKAVYKGMQPLSADDIADCIHWAATRPPHVNINRIEVMPVAQAFSPFAVNRSA